MRVTFVVATLICLLAMPCYACKCGGPGSVEDSYKSTDFIFYAKVIRRDTVLLSETMKEEDVNEVKDRLKVNEQKLKLFEKTPVIKVELQVVEIYKGDWGSKTVIVYIPFLSASCGFRFEDNREYIVYALRENWLAFFFRGPDQKRGYGNDGEFWTTHCTRTTEYNKPEHENLMALKSK